MKLFWKKLRKPILALAPMAGFTDSVFRRICKDYGADVVYSEMASVSALAHNPTKTLRLLRFNESEHPYVVQLFGNNPEHFAFAAKLINSLPLEKGELKRDLKNNYNIKSPRKLLTRNFPLFQRGKLLRPDGIDINFGCPAPKVFKTGAGCALMRNKKLAREIISAVCENTNLPVSLKIRAGLGKTNAIDFIKNIKDLPFSAVMIHGRTYEGGFNGKVDFKIIEKIKKIIPNKIVLANGGINSPENAKNILEKYPSLDGLGIARGALGRPFIFEEIKDLLTCHPERSVAKSKDLIQLDSSATLGMTNKYDFKIIKKIILKHATFVWKEKKKAGIIELRKHLSWYVRNFPGASDLRQKLVQVESLKEIKSILNNKKGPSDPVPF